MNKFSISTLCFALLLLLLITIDSNAQQNPKWSVKIAEGNANSFVVVLDARNISNSSYLQNVSVTVNFYDRNNRLINRRPQKYELHPDGIVDIFRQGQYTFNFSLPANSASVKGIKLKCQQVVNGRFVNRDLPPLNIS